MTTSSYVTQAQGMMQRSARLDLHTSSKKLDAGDKAAEVRTEDENKLRDTKLTQEAKVADLKDRDAWESICDFFGDDGGEADASRDLNLVNADLDRTVNMSAGIKEQQKDATSRMADAIKQGQGSSDRMQDAADFVGEIRNG